MPAEERIDAFLSALDDYINAVVNDKIESENYRNSGDYGTGPLGSSWKRYDAMRERLLDLFKDTK